MASEKEKARYTGLSFKQAQTEVSFSKPIKGLWQKRESQRDRENLKTAESVYVEKIVLRAEKSGHYTDLMP